MLEHFFQCPYCWEEISFLIDTSVNNETYIEDCEVCCRPIEVFVQVNEGELVSFQIKSLE